MNLIIRTWILTLLVSGSCLNLQSQCLENIERIFSISLDKQTLDRYLEEYAHSYSFDCREIGFGYSQYIYWIICDQDFKTRLGLNIVAAGDHIVASSRMRIRRFITIDTYQLDSVAANEFVTLHNAQYKTSFNIKDFSNTFTNLEHFGIYCNPDAYNITEKACTVIEELEEQEVRNLLWHINPEAQLYGLLGMFWHDYEFSLKERVLVDSLLKQNSVRYQCSFCRIYNIGFLHVLENILMQTNNSWKGQDRFKCTLGKCYYLGCNWGID